MRNLYTKNEFLTRLNNNGDALNEGLLKNLWNNAMKLANNIKGKKEVDNIYNKYKKLIDDVLLKINGGTEASGTVKESAIYEAEVVAPASPAAPAAPKQGNTTTQTNQQNTQQPTENKPDDNQVKLMKVNEDRITQLKTQFETEINAVYNKLSKNPDTASDKLNQYVIMLKHKFNSYVYEKQIELYSKTNDQKKITELTTAKKQNDVEVEKDVKNLTAKLGGKKEQAPLEIVKDGTYIYHSNSDNKDIQVTVIGTEKGKDEKGQVDKKEPVHNNMYKVKSANSVFWTSDLKGTPKQKKKVEAKPEVNQQANTQEAKPEVNKQTQVNQPK